MSGLAGLEEKRVRLVAASDLERVKLRLAWHDLRSTIAPPGDPSRTRPWFLRMIGYALPLLGYRKMGTALRVAALGLAAWRAVTLWNTRSR